MDRNKSEVKFVQENVLVSTVGPLKDETAFPGKLMIIEESHGPVIEWHPLKLKVSEPRNRSPELEHLDWEDLSAVEFKSSDARNIDAVAIKAVRKPNAIKFDVMDVKSIRKSKFPSENKTGLTFLLKDGSNVPTLHFNTEDFCSFFAALNNYVDFKKSKKDDNLHLVCDSKDPKSFSELDLFSDKKPHVIADIISHPYNTALHHFSKVTNLLTDYMIYNELDSQSHANDKQISEMISGNFLNVEFNQHEEPGYEVITCIELPPRPVVKREDPVTLEEWLSFHDTDGRIADVKRLKLRIFKGGLVHSVRSEAWKYLLDYYSYGFTHKEKQARKKQKNEDYYRMKLQWKTITPDQESRFSALRERKSLIEKDVSRTDRTHPFYEGDDNLNVQMLQDILMTYCMYNFDLGYVQGMSDLLSPILVIMQNEPDAFWCFAGWLETVGVNFELEQLGMKNQLQDLYKLLRMVDIQLCNYLEKHDSGNLFFAFRWLLILFKRDFKFQEVMRLWEVLWTGLPCKNFHLLLCIAILDNEKLTIMENDYGLTEILKHVNDMSYKINLEETLCKAEAIFLQIKNSKYKPDHVKTILGIECDETTANVYKPSVAVPCGVPIRRDDNSACSMSDSYNVDDYAEIDQKLPFGLFN